MYNWLIAPLLYTILLVGCSKVGPEETKLEYTLKVKSPGGEARTPDKVGDCYPAKVGDTIIISAQAKGPQAKKNRWHVCKDYNLLREHFGKKGSDKRTKALNEEGEECKKELAIDLEGIAIDEPWEMTIGNKYESLYQPEILLKCSQYNEKARSIKARLSEVTFPIKVISTDSKHVEQLDEFGKHLKNLGEQLDEERKNRALNGENNVSNEPIKTPTVKINAPKYTTANTAK